MHLQANTHKVINMEFKYTVTEYFIAHKQELLHNKAMNVI